MIPKQDLSGAVDPGSSGAKTPYSGPILFCSKLEPTARGYLLVFDINERNGRDQTSETRYQCHRWRDLDPTEEDSVRLLTENWLRVSFFPLKRRAWDSQRDDFATFPSCFMTEQVRCGRATSETRVTLKPSKTGCFGSSAFWLADSLVCSARPGEVGPCPARSPDGRISRRKDNEEKSRKREKVSLADLRFPCLFPRCIGRSRTKLNLTSGTDLAVSRRRRETVEFREVFLGSDAAADLNVPLDCPLKTT